MISLPRAVLALSLASLAVACGGSAPESPPPAAPSPPPAATATAVVAPAVWTDSLTFDEKVAIMKTRMSPQLGKVFQTANPQHYANWSCKTCHGPNGKPATEFLPHLTMAGGKLTCFADKPEASKMMASQVVPAAAAALGLPPFDPATKTGFGCPGCHTIDTK